MSDTIQDLYESFAEQMGPIQEDDRYFRYLFELAQASDTTIEQKREVLEKVVDEEWLDVIEGSLDAINAIIEKPRRFITSEEEVVPVSLAKKISADSVRHLAQNTQFLAPSDDGGIHPTRVLNVNTVETYDLYENRFVYHLIQRLLAFVDKRTDVIFWSTGNEICNRLKMHSKIEDAYEEIEYTVEMRVKNRQSFAENDADNVGTFMRIDRVRRLVRSLGTSSFCKLMAGCSTVHSPIQRTNLMIKDPNYRTCYQLWQFMERYDQVGYTVNVKDSEMAFDDEYLIQMYTNLINNYTVFKSLTEDERNLTEVEGTEREPVRPRFVKELKEELVADPDQPDVEVRRVFVEEVTQAQLDAEAALGQERAEGERLRAEVERLRYEAGVLAGERDEQKQAAAEARDAAEAVRAAAEEQAAQAREEARAQVAAAKAGADEKVEAARAEAAGQVAAAQAEAAERVAAAEAGAEERVRAAETAAEQARVEAAGRAQAAEEEAEAKAAAAEVGAEERVAAAEADAEAKVAAAEQAAAAEAAAAKQEAEDQVTCAERAAREQVEAAEAAAAKELADVRAAAQGEVEAVQAASKKALDAARESLDRKSAELEAAKDAAARELEQARADAAAELEAARQELEQAKAEASRELDAARRELDRARTEAASELDDALRRADRERDAQVREARDEMQERVSSLICDLEKAERARAHAQKRADANSLSHYLLKKLRALDGREAQAPEPADADAGADSDPNDGGDGDPRR